MHCTAMNRGVSAGECTEYILSCWESRKLRVCRACPVGQALMATVRPATAFYEPEAEEHMPKKKHIPTNAQLAEAAGLTAGNIGYLLSERRHGRRLTSPSMGKLQAALDRLGLSWDDLEGRTRRRGEAKKASVAPCELESALTEATSDRAPEEAASTLPEHSPDLEKAVENLFAAVRVSEDDDTLSRVAADLEEELAGEACERPVFTPSRPDFSRDFPLSHIPLEALVVEITRRMPRAEVVLR